MKIRYVRVQSVQKLNLVLVTSVEDKIYSGNERQEIKPSTSDKGDSQASGKGTVTNATPGNS